MNQSRQKPIEAAYIPQARRVVTAQFLKAKAMEEELNAKRATAKAMQSVSVRDFKFTTDQGTFRAELKRPKVDQINVQKLYTLVKDGTISLDDFLEVVTAREQLVNDLLGDTKADALREPVTKGLDLIITPA